MSCGTEFALREFAPSYARAAVMQATLAVIGLVAGLVDWYFSRDMWILIAALLLGSVMPYTFFVVMPTNQHIQHPALDASPTAKMRLLERWGRLHAVRTGASLVSFLIFLVRT
jgi:uncharacterized membrane protein